MNKPLTCTAAALLLLAALPAQAATERSYLDLRLLGTSGGGGFRAPDGAGGTLAAKVDTGLGWGVRGAWVFAPRWHLYAEWSTSNTTLDVTLRDAGGATLATEESDFDLDRIALGIGYSWPMGNDWSIYGRLTWDLVEYGDFDRFELDGFGTVAIDDADDNGVGATLGAQWVNSCRKTTGSSLTTTSAVVSAPSTTSRTRSASARTTSCRPSTPGRWCFATASEYRTSSAL